MTKQALLRQIHALDFAILEFELYLDTHPTDSKALVKLDELRAARREAIVNYEKRFGRYIVKSGQAGGKKWNWINPPWPWEYNEEGCM